MTSQAVYCVSLQLRQPSDENGIESIIDTTKQIGDGSADGCDINQQITATNQQTQLSIATVSAANIETQQHQQQQQQPSNIILIRGARTENGQIILQNGHELLSLLNSGTVSISQNDDIKTPTSSPSILLQNSRIKTTTVTNTVTTTPKHTISNESTGQKYVIQSATLKNASLTTNQIIDANTLSGNGVKNQTSTTNSATVLLHSTQALKKNMAKTLNASGTSASMNSSIPSTATTTTTTTTATTIPEGSIILQQRLNKNGTNDAHLGPILLQTLKRLDKSQSILLFRNTQTTGTTTCTLTTASPNIVKTTSVGNQIAVIANKDDDKTESRPKTKTVSMNVPLGADGEPIKLPDNLESLPRADHFPTQRHRWNTNEEIAALLISFDKHSEWQSKEVRTRPKSGSMLLYSRKKVRYRRDGYCWKKRKDGKTTREDHMKLKVQGTECIYGCYVHSAILPTFHRRCYWLLQNPDIVLVHYLNVPYPDDNKMAVITPSLALWGDKKEWTKEELVCQLKPMFFSEDEPDATNEIEITTAETVEAIVVQLMEKQRAARQAALVKQLECGCPDSTCADGKSCSHPMRRITTAKPNANDKQRHMESNNNHVSSTTPNVLIGSRQLYSRWVDRRAGGRDQLTDITNPNTTTTMQHQLTNNSNNNNINGIKDIDPATNSIHFQVIPQNNKGANAPVSASNSSNSSSASASASGKIEACHRRKSKFNSISFEIRKGAGNNSNNTHSNSGRSLTNNNNNNNNNNNTIMNITSAPSSQTSTSTTASAALLNDQQQQIGINFNNQQLVGNNNVSTGNHIVNQTVDNHIGATTNNNTNANNSNHNTNHQMDNGPTNNLHHQNVVNHVKTSTTASNRMVNAPVVTSAPSLVLSLSQIQNSSGSLFILNGQQQAFMSNQYSQHDQHLSNKVVKDENDHREHIVNLVPKLEIMDSSATQYSTKMHQTTVDNNAFMGVPNYQTQSNPNSNVMKQNTNHNDMPTNDTMAFFNETLELSQEDIQKTLSANMPMNSANGNAIARNASRLNDVAIRENILHVSNAHGPVTGVINPMDFIDNCCADEGNIDVGVATSVHDDDVFVNLDAFDMFVEFPELDLDAKSTLHCPTDGNIIDMVNTDVAESIIHIAGHRLEHQPNANKLHGDNIDHHRNPMSDNHSDVHHAMTTHFISQMNDNDGRDGGGAGPGSDLFNISDFSPEWAYPEGGIKVLVTGPWNQNANYTVLFDSFPVPTTIVQSGVLRCYCPAHEVGLVTLQVACDGYVISNSCIFEYKSPHNGESGAACDGTTNVTNNNENLYKLTLFNRLESIEEKMQIKMEPSDSNDENSTSNRINFEDHLVNYCQTLATKQWRSSAELSPALFSWTKYDKMKGMSLLHLAAILGYTRLVTALLSWRSENPNIILDTEIDALNQDNEGYTPLMWSCAKGRTETAITLCKWNSNALNVRNYRKQTPIAVAMENGYFSLSEELHRFETKQKYSPSGVNTSFGRSFLRSPFKCDKSEYLNENDKDENLNDMDKLDGINSLLPISLSQSNDYLESALSPKSVESQTSCRSHDGVFLRPDAISTQSSPSSASTTPTMTALLSNRLTKRTSVDSGINVDLSIPSFRSSIWSRNKNLTREFQLMNSSNSITTAASLVTAATAAGIDTSNDTFSLCVNVTAAKPQQPISDDDESNQHLMNDERSRADNIANDGGETDSKVLTLAEQIIAAMPERIKNESEDIMSLGSPISDTFNSDTSGFGGLSDTFMEPLLDSLPSSSFDQTEFNFEFSDHAYRYHDVGTPCSSLSPASSGPLQSPASYTVATEPSISAIGTIGSPSPPPTTEDFTEFLHASNTNKPFESDFSNLTLTDREQRELYEAAKCIQKAYRSYKGRKKLKEQDKERHAAIVIQNYYRRYKQYAYYRQMTNAALIIQNGYRSYCANKRFKKSQTTGICSRNINNSHSIAPNRNAQCLQSYYNKRCRQQQQQSHSPGSNLSKELNTSGPLKRTYSQRTQNQAARKIQQFMRQSKMKLQKERAEKEKLAHQRREEYLQSLQSHQRYT